MAYLTKKFNFLPFSHNNNKSVYKTKCAVWKAQQLVNWHATSIITSLLHFATVETLNLELIQENAMKLFRKPEILHRSPIKSNLQTIR